MTERLNIPESEYRGLNLPSYSLLKRIDESGPRALKYSKKYDSEAIDFGSLLDCKLLCPSEFDNKFYFDATEKPTEQLLKLADSVFDNGYTFDVDGEKNTLDLDRIKDLSLELGLFGSIKKDDVRIAKFNNELFWNYLIIKQKSYGKTIFTPDTLTECAEAEMILKTHPNTAWLFSPNKEQGYLCEHYNQLMITTEINGITTKVMLDKAVVDHELRTVTLYDLKATEMHMPAFKHHFVKMGYYLQGSLYKEALINLAKEFYPGYVVGDFKFIVYSRSDKFPFIWNMGSEWHKKGLYGFENVFGEHQKGVYELLDDYMFYSQHPDIEVDRKFIENKILEL